MIKDDEKVSQRNKRRKNNDDGPMIKYYKENPEKEVYICHMYICRPTNTNTQGCQNHNYESSPNSYNCKLRV